MYTMANLKKIATNNKTILPLLEHLNKAKASYT